MSFDGVYESDDAAVVVTVGKAGSPKSRNGDGTATREVHARAVLHENLRLRAVLDRVAPNALRALDRGAVIPESGWIEETETGRRIHVERTLPPEGWEDRVQEARDEVLREREERSAAFGYARDMERAFAESKRHIDSAWTELARRFHIGPRVAYERDARENGSASPLQRAVFAAWRSHPRVEALVNLLAEHTAWKPDRGFLPAPDALSDGQEMLPGCVPDPVRVHNAIEAVVALRTETGGYEERNRG